MPRSILAPAVALAVVLAVAPAAQAGFAPAGDEIVTGSNIFVSGVGTDAQGNSLVVWEEEPSGYRARARRLAADGTLGPVIELDPGVQGRDPEVAMTPSGRAFVAWRVDTGGPGGIDLGVSGRWVEADGALGPVVTLAVGKEGELSAGGLLTTVDPAGVVTVAWVNQTGAGKMMLRRVQPDSTLGPMVPDVYGGKPDDLAIAALPDGSTLAIWRTAFLERVVVGPNLELGTPMPISGENNAYEPLLAVDSQGNGLATWRRDSESTFGLRGRLLDPAGNPVGEEMVIRASFPDVFDNSDLAVDSADDFLAIWWAPDAEGDNVVHARPISRISGQGLEQTLSSPDQNSSSAIGEIDDSGSGAVAWNDVMGMGMTIPRAIQISSLGVPASAPQALHSNATMQMSSGSPSAGAAVFLLRVFSGSTQTILARRYLVPPRCVGSSEATLRQRDGVHVPLPCMGAGMEAAEVVGSPGRGTVGHFNAFGPSVRYTPKPGAGGGDRFTVRVVNDGGQSNVVAVSITDGLRPAISRFKLVRPKARRGAGASARTGGRKKRRPYFTLRISEPARARVTVERAVRGVRRGKRCVRAGRGTAGKRCNRYVRVGRIGSKAARRSLRLPLPLKIARKLARPGRYRASAIATDTAGNRSRPRRISIRPPKR